MATPLHPSLYQINTRVWLTALAAVAGPAGHAGRHPGRGARSPGRDGLRLDLVAERLADRARRVSASRAPTRSGGRNSRTRCRISARTTSRDLASPSPDMTSTIGLGGDAALARLRERLRARGLRLLLDFVPNHTGLDHPWVQAHPEYFVPGTDDDLARAPQNYTLAPGRGTVIACSPTDATRTSPAGQTRCS